MTDREIAYTRQCIRDDIHRFYTWSRWEQVRRQVLEMDKHECQDCKARGIYDSVEQVLKVNTQLLKILDSLGIKPSTSGGGEEDEL